MRGIERAKVWYEGHLSPLLESDFGELFPRIAVGMAGRGSECFGFDDEISRDHDASVGVSLWLTDEDEARYGFRLQRAYDKLAKETLPREGEGRESKLGPCEHGVVRIGDFYRRHTGIPRAPENWREWLYTPEYAFAEATNGEVFRDELGAFTGIRDAILHDMPEDVRLKKLAARTVMMAQSGQYNFARCLRHGEGGAAALALGEFVRNAVSLVFLLNFRFAPYYKWMFRAMRQLPELGELTCDLESLLTKEEPEQLKQERIEKVCAEVLKKLRSEELTSGTDPYLEPHAFEIMKRIRSRELRELHVMEG